jgi:hypothetical protein
VRGVIERGLQKNPFMTISTVGRNETLLGVWMLNNSGNPWMQTVGLLRFASVAPHSSDKRFTRSTAPLDRLSRSVPAAGRSSAVSVRVLDRPSSTTATIVWSDPTSCYYGDQVWRRSVARQSGVCAATGLPIRAGDDVYKPRCKPMPANGNAVILASVVHRTMDFV